jgi:hypothetical protein
MTGASLSPLSTSSAATIRRGSGSRRRLANTAAASVELTTAPSSSANCQSSPSSHTQAAAVVVTLTTTPTVDSARAGPTARRTSFHRVVSPPSARMTTSAATPRVWVSWTSSKSTPRPFSPSATPSAR